MSKYKVVFVDEGVTKIAKGTIEFLDDKPLIKVEADDGTTTFVHMNSLTYMITITE